MTRDFACQMTVDVPNIGYQLRMDDGTAVGSRVTTGIMHSGTGSYVVRGKEVGDATFFEFTGTDTSGKSAYAGDYFGPAADQILLASLYVPSDEPQVIVPVPTIGNHVMGVLITRDAFGNLTAGVKIDFQVIQPGDGDSYSNAITSVASGANGQLQKQLPKNTKYRARRGASGAWIEFTTGTTSPYELPGVLGNP